MSGDSGHEFNDWCAEVVEWHKAAFPTETMEQLGLCLGEESGELQRTILKESHGANDRRADWDWRTERAAEIGDVMISLACIAERDGVDLMAVLWARFDYVSKRFPVAIAD